jgi:hypothetical protein
VSRSGLLVFLGVLGALLAFSAVTGVASIFWTPSASRGAGADGRPKLAITGTVKDASTGQAPPGYRVRASRDGLFGIEAMSVMSGFVTPTSRLALPSPGRWTVRAFSDGPDRGRSRRHVVEVRDEDTVVDLVIGEPPDASEPSRPGSGR